MSLTKCEKCGEMYADSYKSCPFCAEDAEYYNGRVKKSTRRPNESKVKRPSAVGPVMILVVLLILAALIWIIFGGHIGTVLGDREPTEQEQTVDMPAPDDTVIEEELAIDKTSILLSIGSSETLHIEDEENVEWESSAPAVAVVTSSGTVKGLAVGSAIITARCGDKSATCSVSVTEDTIENDDSEITETTTTTKPDTVTKPDSAATGKVNLSNMKLYIPAYGTYLQKGSDGGYDVSMTKNESFQIEVQGVTGKVTWSSGNTGIVTVSSDGTLTRVASGETTVTGKIGTESFTILVRCK